MYGTIRVLLGVFLFGSFVLIVRKNGFIRQRLLYIVGILTSIALMIGLYFLPIENCFLTFRKPEEAYQYVTFGKANIVHKIDGHETTFMIDRTINADRYQIIPKSENGWKIGIGANTDCVYQNSVEGAWIKIYRYKNSDDYYLFVETVNTADIEVNDSRNSGFYKLESGNGHFVTYCTCLSKLDEQYWVRINDTQIPCAI